MSLHIEYTTAEKAAKLTDIIKDVASRTEFGAADLKSLHLQAVRIGISIDELQQYIALLKSRDIVAGEVVGSNYYIIPKNL